MCVRAQTQTNDAASAAEPSWWSGIWTAGRVNADNDAPINVGQLKHVASRALAWLETRSITEAEEPAAYAALGVFRGMVAGWTPGPVADNAAPVPVGALKETAAKFHDVLAALGYPLVTGETVGDVLEAEEGLTNPPRYPWGAAGTLEELQAPANVGQLKTAFRAPHPGLVKESVGLHGALTVADNGLPVAGPETLTAQTLPVWGHRAWVPWRTQRMVCLWCLMCRRCRRRCGWPSLLSCGSVRGWTRCGFRGWFTLRRWNTASGK